MTEGDTGRSAPAGEGLGGALMSGECSADRFGTVTEQRRDAAAPELVFVHGFGSDGRVWEPVLSELGGAYRTAAIDLAGSGERSKGRYSAERYTSLYPFAEDILVFLEEEGFRRPRLIGHSVGAMICLLAARMRPDAVSGVMTICGSPRYVNDTGYHGGFERADVEGLMARMEENFCAWASGFAPYAMGNPDRPELARRFAESLSAMRPDVAMQIARVIFYSDHREDLRHIGVPVRVVQSRDDIAVPASVAEYLGAKLPEATVAYIDATGHLPHVSAPGAVVSEIRKFLSPRQE
jgi:sigma-B regulation protein RsbQ